MEKIKISNNTFIYPMSIVMAGAMVEGKINYMAVGWVTRVNGNPPMVGFSSNKVHYTNKGIRKYKEFSICIPSLDLIKEVDYGGIVSGSKVDKSELFESFYGELKYAPMIKNCPISMECKLAQVVELPSHEFFIGEIIGVYTEERYITEGKPDIKKINPFTLTMPDNNYWSIGEMAGKAWNIGKMVKK